VFARVSIGLSPGERGSGVTFTFSESVQPPNADDECDDDELKPRGSKSGGGGGKKGPSRARRSDGDDRDADRDGDDSDASGGDSAGGGGGDGETTALSLRTIREAVCVGASSALSRGVLLGYPMTDVVVHVAAVEQSLASTPPAFRQAASQAVSLALRALRSSQGAALLEPVMAAEVSVAHAHLAAVLNDLVDRRRASIGDVVNRGTDVGVPTLVQALVPLSEMIGYASAIRSLTQGNASFTMRLADYQLVQAHHLKRLLANPPA
jgi:translation elongation factor EF-G